MARLKTSSAKQKGRRLQQQIVAALMEIGAQYGLEEGDILSRGMGQNGEDVMLSPAARRVFDLWIEAKNVEALSVLNTFIEHYDKYKNKDGLKILVHARNIRRKKEDQEIDKETLPLVTMRFADFLGMIAQLIEVEQTPPPRKIGFGNKGKLKNEA